MALTRIGHYTIVSELGRGGMGVVYKAHEESLNRFVAIKVLADQLSAEPEFVTRFVREARAAAALSHPNIIQIYYIGEDEGRQFFVMEYVSGRSLLAIAREAGRIENPRAAKLMLQAAHGLAAAHDVDMLHRDIKPANLMVDARDFVKIADFGLALPLSTVTRLTATGMLMGTPGYLSPEQCMGEKLDCRTDIYSLGVTFYEILSGRLPFHADSPLALLRKIVEEEPPDISSLNERVDEATHAIVHRMIAKDRARRYPDCHELAADLEEYIARFDRDGSRRLREAGKGAAPVAAAVVQQASSPDPDTTERLEARDAGPDEATTLTANAPPPPAAAPRTTVAEPVAPAPLPSPPSALAAPAAAEIVPAPAAVPAVAPPAVKPQRRSHAALLAVALLVLAVAALAGGGVLLMRSSLLSRFLPGGTKASARSLVSASSPESGPARSSETSTAAEGQAPPVEGKGAAAAGGAGAAVTAERGGAAAGGAVGGAKAAEFATTSASSPAGRVPAPSRGTSGAVALHAGPSAREAAPVQAPAVVARQGLAVAAVGEPELAGVVEGFLSSELSSAGIEAQSAAALPAAEDVLRGGGMPRTAEILASLRDEPLASLVLARVVPVGQRQLVYMGRSDTAYSSRVEITTYDLETGRPRGSTLTATVEYTSLTAERETSKALQPLVRELVQRLR